MRHDPVNGFRFVEPAGPYSVGLQVIEQYDYSRTFRYSTDELGRAYSGECSRPLQTLVWYPAAAGKPAMTVGDYVDLCATEMNFERARMPARGNEWLAGMRETLKMPLWAVRDAPSPGGPFPVVIYAPSFSSPAWENADLCEYLASHGYLVIASASIGPRTRNMTPDMAGIEAQARDIAFLIGYAKTRRDADVSAVAVIGFSWGGIANLFAAARDHRIKALVALDGSLRYFPGFVQGSADVRAERMSTPLLYFAQGLLTIEDWERYFTSGRFTAADGAGPNVLNSWTHGDLTTIQMRSMTHRAHSSMYQRNEDSWKDLPDWQMADYGRDDAAAGYGWMARYTREFLDAYIRQRTSAFAFLEKRPPENGVPRHLMTVQHRRGSGIPASFEGFRQEVGRRGFAGAAEILAAIRSESCSADLDEQSFVGWSEALIESGHPGEARTLLELNAQMRPGSSLAHTSLGDVHMRLGDTGRAVEAYRKALECARDNVEAKRKLRALEGDADAARPPAQETR